MVDTGVPLVTADFSREGRSALAQRDEYRAVGPLALVPMRSEEGIIGTLCVARLKASGGTAFTAAEARLREGIAEVAGTAIRRASLYQSHHQERWDGTGYPDKLRGEAIPLGARILAVVDAYGAMTETRPYRPARTHAEAVEEIRRCAGTQFDPRVAAVFCAVVERGEDGPSVSAASDGPPGDRRS